MITSIEEKFVIDFYDLTIHNELVGTVRFKSLEDLDLFYRGILYKFKHSHASYEAYKEQCEYEDSQKEEC